MSTKTQSKNNEAILETARKRFDLAVDAERDIRSEALDDLKFRVGEQWDDRTKNARTLDGRPCLVVNRIPQFIRQITNDQRQNRPSLKVHPVDEQADIETAKILQGLIRHIEYNSNADVAYDTALDGAASKGFGYFRIRTDYVDPMSFDQEILIESINNHFSVYLDPNHKKPDGSDTKWGFIFEDIYKEEYKQEYTDSELASMDDWESVGNSRAGWIAENTCRIAEYFCREIEEVDVVLLNNGKTIKKSELQSVYPKEKDIPKGLIINERKAQLPIIKWYKINAVEILEETTWLGQWIPIIPVYGDWIDIDGKKTLEGVIRHAKDPQRMLNYWKSTEAETISLAPKAPYIVAEGQIPPEYAHQWAEANSKNHAYLTYKPTSITGQLIGAPQRNSYEPPVMAITNAGFQASEDLKATTGIYDASLGNRSNESSGIAIARRANQAQTSNFHFVDNLTRSLRHAGRIIIELIPKIYDTPRTARIIGEEGEQQVIRLNEMFQHKGKPTLFNLSAGKYDVTVETGPSFATKRQEAAASMVDVAKACPQIMNVAPDLLVKSMDWPGSSEIAERLKKSLPPGMAEDDKKQQPIPPQAQAQMQQMNQMIEQLTEKLNSATKIIETKSNELESRERIEMQKLQVQLEIEMARIGSQESQLMLKQEIAQIENRLNLLQQNQPIDQDYQQSPQSNNESGSYGAEPQQNMPTDGQQSSGLPPQGGLTNGY